MYGIFLESNIKYSRKKKRYLYKFKKKKILIYNIILFRWLKKKY